MPYLPTALWLLSLLCLIWAAVLWLDRPNPGYRDATEALHRLRRPQRLDGELTPAELSAQLEWEHSQGQGV